MSADELAQLLDELQSRIDGPAAYVFELAVRQAIISGTMMLIGSLFLGAILVVSALVVSRIAWRRWQRDQDRWEKKIEKDPGAARYPSLGGKPDLLDWAIPGVLVIFPAAILTAMILSMLTSGLSKLLNPEYVALTDVISRIVP